METVTLFLRLSKFHLSLNWVSNPATTWPVKANTNGCAWEHHSVSNSNWMESSQWTRMWNTQKPEEASSINTMYQRSRHVGEAAVPIRQGDLDPRKIQVAVRCRGVRQGSEWLGGAYWRDLKANFLLDEEAAKNKITTGVEIKACYQSSRNCVS